MTRPKKIHLVSGVNEPYLKRAEPFIESADRNSNLNNIIITLDFTAPTSFTSKYPSVRFIHHDSALVEARNPNTCLQHGGFLGALGSVGDDDIIIFTDADIDIQRPFTVAEIDYLQSFVPGDIGVGYNADPEQTLIEEGKNLGPIRNNMTILSEFPGADRLKVFNTGVVVARKSTYQSLYKNYINNWDKVAPLFKHYAKQQWLLSYLIQKDFNTRILSNAIHTHDHHPVEQRVTGDYGYKFCIENTPVVFAHHLQPTSSTDDTLSNAQLKRQKKRRLFWQRLAWIELLIILLLAFSLLCIAPN